ncbi:aspartyl protease family protein [Changchengzhania lutea]|uniref:aspartyl protease family protein n=1 Tax=Changchengzhania lutea TaxID=2049305 RepID=UPI00115C9FBD|nr:aspartyl protease family protein [Changchengzhania lutea]
MKKLIVGIILLFFVTNLLFSQGNFVIQNKKTTSKIKFKLINNLIILPVEVNGVTLSFLLDTGVSKPILFNFLNITDTLKIKNSETIYLQGLGKGEAVEALRSSNNIFKIGDAINLNQELYAIYDNNLSFAPRLGVPVHGIIGFDVFKNMVVHINYVKQHIKLTESDKYEYRNCKNCESLSLEFYNNKPYVNATVQIEKKTIPIKLLIDSGGSDSLWLFENDSLGIGSSDKHFYDFLGHGLSGSIYGKRSKVQAFSLKSFVLHDANVAYPDSLSITLAKRFKGRNGSLAGNILKRFHVVFDYRRAKITLKKNSKFNEKFRYNKSGIELSHDGFRLIKERDDGEINLSAIPSVRSDNVPNSNKIVLDARYKIVLKPAYAIVELRENSPAQISGLTIGDIILEVNGVSTHKMSLQQVMDLFYGEIGKHMKLKVDRDGLILGFDFYLEDLFK